MDLEHLSWSLCCLCQTDVGGEIRCPAQSKRRDKGAGYETNFTDQKQSRSTNEYS